MYAALQWHREMLQLTIIYMAPLGIMGVSPSIALSFSKQYFELDCRHAKAKSKSAAAAAAHLRTRSALALKIERAISVRFHQQQTPMDINVG